MLKNNIALIIVNWKQYELTNSCLLSLQNSKCDNIQIILVDNESNKEKLNFLKNQFNEIVTFSNERNLGFTGANNIGIKYAIKNNFEYVMLLNNDTEVNQNFMVPLIGAFQKDNNLGAAQPLIMNFFDKKQVWNAGGSLNNFFGTTTIYKKQPIKNKKVDWITGCCMILKKEIFKEVGLLDEDFFAYYEDLDLSLRIKKNGYNLKLIPSSIIYHHGSKSSQNQFFEGILSPEVHYLNIRNHLLVIKKHFSDFNFLGVVFFQFFKITSYFIYFLIRLRFNKFKMVFKGLGDGLK